MHIVGTAGHVDHGKSALIAALTGTNPDRLIEEQIRGNIVSFKGGEIEAEEIEEEAEAESFDDEV